MASTAVASPFLGSHFDAQRSHYGKPNDAADHTDYSSLASVDWGNPSLSHQQKVALADLIRQYQDGTLSALLRAMVDSQLASASPSGPESSSSPTTDTARKAPRPRARKQPGKKSVRFDHAKSESYKGGRNDGNDGISEPTLLYSRDWKSRSSRATPTRPKKVKRMQKKHWDEFQTAYETARDGGVAWAYVPTSTMTLQSDFPTLYRWAERPREDEANEETRRRWDEEDDRRMDLKLKPLREIKGVMGQLGSRATVWDEMGLDDQRTWARDNMMMRDKYMSVLCSTAEERRRYLGLEGESEPEGMQEVLQEMAETRSKAKMERAEKTKRNVNGTKTTSVPVETSDTRYSQIIDTALDDLESYSTALSRSTVTKEKAEQTYLSKLAKKKWLTDTEKSALYPHLAKADDCDWLVELGKSEDTQRRFCKSIRAMRERGQKVVRPTALFDHGAFKRRRKARQKAALEDDDWEDYDGQSDGNSTKSGRSVSSSASYTSADSASRGASWSAEMSEDDDDGV